MSPTSGVEIRTAADYAPSALLELVARHGFVVARGIPLSRDAFAELIKQLGTIVRTPFLIEDPPGSGIAVLEHRTPPEDFDHNRQVVFASGWHSDWTFLPQPPTLSVLYCERAPEAGGETLLCDTVGGLKYLSPTFRSFLRTLDAEHRSDGSFSSQSSYALKELVGAQRRDYDNVLTATHPLMAASPLGGIECVFFSPSSISQLNGLAVPETNAILHLLRETLLWHEYIARITWQDGTLLLWDNYRFVHRALNQGLIGQRTLLRTNLLTTAGQTQ